MFFNIYDAFSEYQYTLLSSLDSAISDNLHMPSSTIECHFSSEKEWDELVDFVYNHSYITVTGNEQILNNGRKVQQTYYYIPNSYTLSYLQEKDENTIDFSKPENKYMTTNLSDSNKDGVIDVLDKSYYEAYQDVVEAHTFSSIKSLSKTKTGLIVYFVTDHIQDLKDDLQNANLSCVDKNTMRFNEFPTPIPLFDYFSNQIVVYVAIGLALCLTCLVFSQKKEIVIRKIFGQSTWHIMTRLYMPILLIMSICFTLPYFVCYLVNIQTLRMISREVTLYLIEVYVLFVILVIGISIVLYSGIRHFQQYLALKKREDIRSIQYGSLLLKLFFILTLFVPMSQITNQMSYLVPNTYAFLSHPDNFQGYIHFDSYDTLSRQFLDYETMNSLFCDYFNENNAILADFDQVVYVSDNKSIPYIMINEEYLKMQGLPIEKADKDLLLVPEKYRNISMDTLMITNASSNVEIRYIDNGAVYYGLSPQSLGMMKSPIVLLKHQIENAMTPGIFLLEDQEKEFTEFMEQTHQNEAFQLLNTTNEYIFAKSKTEKLLMNVIAMLFMYVGLLLLFQYQTVYIHFLENEKKSIIDYMFGYTFWRRHKLLFFENLFIYATAVLYLLVQDNPTMHVLTFTGSILFLDILLMIFFIRILERKNATKALKGGSE